jgi:DHA1 family bicyclomycin/chloramphenicol resistance-like MFS transporter
MHFFVDIRLWMFLIYAGILFFTIGLMFGNLNAIAMEPMAHVAGIASAVIGSVSSLISMVLGAVIGQLYNNTLIPIVLGFLLLNSLSLCIIMYAERGKRLTEES